MKQIKKVGLVLGIMFSIFFTSFIVLAFTSPSQAPTGGNVDVPINVGSGSQVKVGALEVQGALIARNPTAANQVAIKSYVDDICRLVQYTAGGTQAQCPAGYYVTEMPASGISGYMLCCRVSNPL